MRTPSAQRRGLQRMALIRDLAVDHLISNLWIHLFALYRFRPHHVNSDTILSLWHAAVGILALPHGYTVTITE
jgi:hypothetical protein